MSFVGVAKEVPGVLHGHPNPIELIFMKDKKNQTCTHYTCTEHSDYRTEQFPQHRT